MFNTLGNSISRSGLAGEWLLDGNAIDTSGNGNNGTATNVTYVKTDKGYQSQAGSFNGSSSFITSGFPTQVANVAIYTSLWIKRAGTGSGANNCIMQYGPSQISIRFGFWINSSNQLGIWNSGGGPTYSTIVPTLNTWEHYIFGRDGANVYIYKNGQLAYSVANVSNDGASVISAMRIAQRENNSGEFYNGQIQGVRTYNRAISQYEIQLLYLEGLRQLGPTATPKYPSLLSGLVGYWDFRGTAHNLVDGSLATITLATLTTDRFGYSNSAYSYTSNNCSIDTITLPTISTGAYSLHGAFYPTVTATSGDYNIVWRWSTGVANEEPIYFYYGGYGTNQYRILVQNTSNSYFGGTFNKTFSANTWYNITITVGGGNIKVYFDGVLDQTIAYTGTAYTRTTGFAIGNRGYNRNEGWEGKIQDTFLFNKELSSDEVNILNNLTSKDYIYPTPSYDLASLQDGLLIYLNGSNNGATTLYDISGNGKNGTVSSTPTYNRQGKKKTVSLSSQSVSWTSTSFTMATCFENISGKWTLQVNPAYITTTGITSGTREITDIRVYNRSLSSIEQEQLKYAVIGNFIY